MSIFQRIRYDRAGFFFNKRKWVVYLQSQKEESSYKIKKFRLDCSEVLIYADGSGVFNERKNFILLLTLVLLKNFMRDT